VFGLSPATRIYLAAGVTDLRKGFERSRDRLSTDTSSGFEWFASSGVNTPRGIVFRRLEFYRAESLSSCTSRLNLAWSRTAS